MMAPPSSCAADRKKGRGAAGPALWRADTRKARGMMKGLGPNEVVWGAIQGKDGQLYKKGNFIFSYESKEE